MVTINSYNDKELCSGGISWEIKCWWPRSDGCLRGKISWFMLFYERSSRGNFNIWSEVSLKFLVLFRMACKNLIR